MGGLILDLKILKILTILTILTILMITGRRVGSLDPAYTTLRVAV